MRVRMYQSDPFSWTIADMEDDWLSLYEIPDDQARELLDLQSRWWALQNALTPKCVDEDDDA